MLFCFKSLEFSFIARERLRFPQQGAANTIRGALGTVAREHPQFDRIFQPIASGPSGLVNRPRPFVFRARHLDGAVIRPGESFAFRLILFDDRPEAVHFFQSAFQSLDQWGLAADRAPVQLASTFERAFAHSLAPERADFVRVRFVTPTHLKGSDAHQAPPFWVLAARLRERIFNLSRFCSETPPPFSGPPHDVSSTSVTLASSSLKHSVSARRSSRTGQMQLLKGIVGEACYRGPVSEALPYLRLAKWTGVGRHAVWGNGELEVETA